MTDPLKFRPLHDWVLLKQVSPSEKYGSLVIPEAYRRQGLVADEADVVRVGPGIWSNPDDSLVRRPMRARAGARVLFRCKYEAAYHRFDSAYVLVHDFDVLGVFDGERFRPLHDWILIKRDEASTGRIVVPKQFQQEVTTGVVVSVGDGRDMPDGSMMPLDVKPGERVWFGRYVAIDIEVHGEKYTMMNQTNVIAAVSPERPERAA
jgi:chaperonin GroES